MLYPRSTLALPEQSIAHVMCRESKHSDNVLTSFSWYGAELLGENGFVTIDNTENTNPV